MADAVQTGSGAKALVLVKVAHTRWQAMPAPRRTRLIAGGAGLLALILAVSWYMGRPDWRVLFSGLDGKDVQQVSQELAAAGIPFEATADGTGVQVPAESLDKARMEVAAKGMPQSGRLGFELFDKPNWVGSEFDEKVNYQRALEGELEHTIATLGVVHSARVHLALPQASLFSGEQKVAKASVVLKLKRGSLSPDQTESIRNLVAGAVENLQPDQVTLVDADGRANLQAHGAAAAHGEAEQAMEARLLAMLEPLAGAGNVRATVNVAYDDSSEERTDEVYDPTTSVPLSVQKTEQNMGGAHAPAAGVPGTASNTPAASAAGAVQGSAASGAPPLLQKDPLPVYPQNGAGNNGSMKQENSTYAVTRHLLHAELGPGRIKRVTAAIVVNDRLTADASGKPEKATWKPRTTEELHRFEGLAQAAVGFDEKRGDSVILENVSFNSNVPDTPVAGVGKVMEEATGMLGAQPGLMRSGVLAGLGLLTILFVLKPVAGQMVKTLKEPLALAPGTPEVIVAAQLASASTTAAKGDDTRNLPAGEQVPRVRARNGDGMLEQVTEHIRREPAGSTRLLESWIGAEEEAG